MKRERQAAILRLVTEQEIETQLELQLELEDLGIFCTQATISRDIKELHLIKAPTGHGNYHYMVADSSIQDAENRLRTIFWESVASFDYAQNIVVLKTMPGLASAACANLDAMKVRDLLGTIAGDDTGILIMRSEEAAAAFCGEMQKML